MKKKILVTLLLISYLLWLNSVFLEQTFATSNSSNVSLDDFSTLTDVNKWTFNEYRYRIINEYFSLKSSYESSGIMNKQNLENMSKFAKTWYNYLPDSLINKNLLNDLLTSLKKAYTENNSEVNYEDVVAKMDKYIKNVRVDKVQGTIRATPSSWNAPLNVTLTWDVRDPTWSLIPDANFTWWLDAWGKKVVIWNKRVLNYTFVNESTYTVFLDVKSTHKK